MLGPHLCPRNHQSRANKPLSAAGIRTIRDGATYEAVLAGPIAPSQPSGPMKLTAIDSYPSESGVSSETINRRICSDISRPLSDMPDGTTGNAQVAKACIPA